jgi:hypothetical protein
MRKLLLLIITLILFETKVFSCTCDREPYCLNIKNGTGYQDIILGSILSFDSISLQLLVEKVYRGNESRDTITIWADTTYYGFPTCFIPMGTHIIGPVGGRIVINLLYLDSSTVQHSWDVIGDYRRPDWCGYTNELTIANDSVYGYINGTPWFVPCCNPPWFLIEKMAFSRFDSLWSTGNLDCSGITVGLEDQIQKEPRIWIWENTLHIKGVPAGGGKLRVFNSLGQELLADWVQGDSKISLEGISERFLMVEWSGKAGRRRMTKVMFLDYHQ